MRSPKLISITLIAIMVSVWHPASAQEPEERTFDGELSWQAVSTELESQALAVAAKVIPKLNVQKFFSSDSSFTLLSPDIELKTGGNDSFDSLIVKMTGLTVLDPPKGDDNEPDYTKFLNTFTYSAGFETTRNMNSPAALIEIGWVPILKAGSRNERFGLDSNRRFALFLQTGYKFRSDGTPEPLTGGAVDESKESPDEAIARVKADLHLRVKWGDRVVVMPVAQYWYDLKNSKSYYSISGTMRIEIAPKRYYWDVKFEKGSGAPNFNEGSQFSTGLTLAF